MRAAATALLAVLTARPIVAEVVPPLPPPVPLRGQLSINWCWAASAQMAMMALRKPEELVLQHIQAARAYPPCPDCSPAACLSGHTTTSCCAYGGFPQFYKFGFDAEIAPMHRPLTAKQLRRELGCRPVVFAREDLDENGVRTGTGHMEVATSAGAADQRKWIAVSDPQSKCMGRRRFESYETFLGDRSRAHWIDYYGLRELGTPFVKCPEPAAFDEGGIREADSAAAVVSGFLEAVQDNSWIRSLPELGGPEPLACDLEHPVPERTITVQALRSAGASLVPILIDIKRLRFICHNGAANTFSVEAVQQPSSKWRVATIGDGVLAARLEQIRGSGAQEIEEVLVQGLNVRFARLAGAPLPVIPFEAIPEYGILAVPQSESGLIASLLPFAASFRPTGPS
jgi:hypothetical protein